MCQKTETGPDLKALAAPQSLSLQTNLINNKLFITIYWRVHTRPWVITGYNFVTRTHDPFR